MVPQSTTRGYSIQSTTPVLLRTTKDYASTTCTTERSTSEPGIEPRTSRFQGYNALSARQIFWDDHIRKIVIANTMRRAIVQVQNTNVRTPRTMPAVCSFARSAHRILREVRQNQNVRFATAACRPKSQTTAARTKMYETSAWRRRSPAAYKNHRFTTVSDVRPARSDERVAGPREQFAFRHSFGRPTSTK